MATSSTARKRQAPDLAADTPNRRNKRAPSTFKRFLRLVLLVLIIIAASVGATLYYTWPSGASLFNFLPNSVTSVESEPAVIEEVIQESPALSLLPAKPIFVRLEPFTVTITEGGNRTRILHVAITLQVAEDRTKTTIDEYMPVVRDRVLRILSEQHPQYIQTSEGREQLVATLKHSLSQPFNSRSSGPDISHVLFTAFVIQ